MSTSILEGETVDFAIILNPKKTFLLNKFR
jgi:hypothetical protein